MLKILSFFFPKYCMQCEEIMPYNRVALCEKCQTKIQKSINAKELYPNLFLYCEDIFIYASYINIDRVIHKVKFYEEYSATKPLSYLYSEVLLKQAWIGEIDCIVYVPKYSKREYNVVKIIAKQVSKRLNIPLEEGVLVKTHPTAKQHQVKPQERIDNIIDSFCIKHPEKIENKNILLMDDVITTGITITECCKVLRSVKDTKIYTSALSTWK